MSPVSSQYLNLYITLINESIKNAQTPYRAALHLVLVLVYPRSEDWE
jgi:hypothetical protein